MTCLLHIPDCGYIGHAVSLMAITNAETQHLFQSAEWLLFFFSQGASVPIYRKKVEKVASVAKDACVLHTQEAWKINHNHRKASSCFLSLNMTIRICLVCYLQVLFFQRKDRSSRKMEAYSNRKILSWCVFYVCVKSESLTVAE